MELQLSLALFPTDRKGLDLNSSAHEPKEVGLGKLNPPAPQLGLHPLFSSFFAGKKRNFDDAFDEATERLPRTLPLLLWDRQPNEEDDPKDLQNSATSAYSRIDDEGLVGWPPIKCRRKKLYRQISNGGIRKRRTVDNGCAQCQSGPSNSNYVKVKMDGLVIARKIDKTKYQSFQTLKRTLLGMFGICQEDTDEYKLTYQDSEGDWLLAEDTPSMNVMGSVKRLRLMRNGG